jgi:condensin complex subunit 1
MCISSKFCEEHLLLLLRILETSVDPTIRSNIVIALGDIAVCFSTLIDENSDRLYKGLSDDDLTVKKNTLMVLTHLILNGMVKVKGQLGEMAKCLEDEDPRVSDLAKLFFTELSTKDNAIYNNIQDG